MAKKHKKEQSKKHNKKMTEKQAKKSAGGSSGWSVTETKGAGWEATYGSETYDIEGELGFHVSVTDNSGGGNAGSTSK